MKKVISNTLTAGMLSKNFKETIKYSFIEDTICNLMPSIKYTPT